MTSLVADIGGTNTRVALADEGRINTESVRRYRNADYDALWPIIREYLDHQGITQTDGACICAAGPVHNGSVTLTNLAWTIDEQTLGKSACARKAIVLNDLAAQGYALSALPADARQTIMHGDPYGNCQLVIGLGTGVNAAVVHRTPAGYFVPSSESGHIALPTPTPDLIALRDFIARIHGLATVEEALAGRGISLCHAFAAERAGSSARLEAQQVMDALIARDPVATEGMRIFVQALAAFTSDLALIHLPFGGIYLVGGVSRAVAPFLEDFDFEENFREKGRLSHLMRDFSLGVVNDDYAALTGCAAYLKNSAHTLPSSSEN